MFENSNQDEYQGNSMPEFQPGSFTDIPAVFYQGLTPEQIRHRSQLYQIAFEKARETISRRNADQVWMSENGLTYGDGI